MNLSCSSRGFSLPVLGLLACARQQRLGLTSRPWEASQRISIDEKERGDRRAPHGVKKGSKRDRQYKDIVKSERKRGVGEGRAEEIPRDGQQGTCTQR